MTEEELCAMEARAEAATPGPYRVEHRADGYLRVLAPHQGGRNRKAGHVAKTSSAADAEFIARARADIPALVAEVRRLRQVLSAPGGSDGGTSGT